MISFEAIAVVSFLILGIVAILFFIFQARDFLSKKRSLEAKVNRLEKDMQQIKLRSERHVGIFKEVVNGFDHIVKGCKTALELEDKENIKVIGNDTALIKDDKESSKLTEAEDSNQRLEESKEEISITGGE